MEGEGRETLAKKPGHTVYKVSDKFRADMQAASAPAKKEWQDAVRKAGYDPDQVWNSLVAAMEKNKAN